MRKQLAKRPDKKSNDQPTFRVALNDGGEVWVEIEAEKLGWFLMALEIEQPEQEGHRLRIKLDPRQLEELAEAIKAAQEEMSEQNSECQAV